MDDKTLFDLIVAVGVVLAALSVVIVRHQRRRIVQVLGSNIGVLSFVMSAGVYLYTHRFTSAGN